MESGTVNDIASRLAATRQELASTIAALATMPARKESALGADTFSEATVTKLENEEATLTKKRDHLQTRIPLLEKQAEAEETTRAQLRIYSLVEESSTLRQQYDAARTQYDLAVATLKAAIDTLEQRHQDLLSVADEQSYLLTRYHGLEQATLSSPGDFPALDELERIGEPLRLHPYKIIGWNRTPWSREAYDLEAARHAERQREAKVNIPGHVRQTAV